MTTEVTADLLGQRIDRECDELDRMEQFVDGGLLVQVLAADTLSTLRAQLSDCRRSVRNAGRYLGDPGWTALRNAAVEARRPRGEIFALVQGQLFRSAELDDGVSAAAGRCTCSTTRGSGSATTSAWTSPSIPVASTRTCSGCGGGASSGSATSTER